MHVVEATRMMVIQRDDLPAISSTDVDGVRHELGEVRDFHRHPALAAFVPEQARLSLSWVRLAAGQELAEHVHPTASMVLVTEGRGTVSGDATGPLAAGDAVIVPAGARHGFAGAEPDGFWGLSVQFEGPGLYEDVNRPRVAFASADTDGVAAVRAANARHMHAFGESDLLALVRRLAADPDEALLQRLLEHLQPWSDAFQRVIAVRAAFETDGAMLRLSEEHLEEELGHHRLLAGARGDGAPGRWDPVVAAVSAWWVDKMMTSPSVGRTALAHLVLEGSGMVFHQAAYPVLGDGDYFAIHAEGDEEHLEMGYRALAGRGDWTTADVLPLLEEGWEMMTTMCDRIAACAQS